MKIFAEIPDKNDDTKKIRISSLITTTEVIAIVSIAAIAVVTYLLLK